MRTNEDLRKMIVKDHSNCNEYNGNCGTSFGEVLCAHIHLCNIPFKILAKHFKITKEELAYLIYEHILKL